MITHKARALDAPAPVRFVVRVREHPVTHAGAEVGGVRPVGQEGHGRLVARRTAPSRSPPRRVLRVARLHGLAADRRAPARAPSRPRGGRCARSRGPAGCRVPAPVLQPAPPPFAGPRAHTTPGAAANAGDGIAVPGVEHVDGAVALEQRGVVSPRARVRAGGAPAQRERRAVVSGGQRPTGERDAVACVARGGEDRDAGVGVAEAVEREHMLGPKSSPNIVSPSRKCMKP